VLFVCFLSFFVENARNTINIPWTASRPSQTVVGRLFLIFLFFNFSLHSTLDGGTSPQTVELRSVLECDWKMRFIVPKNHPERKRTSILV